MRKVFAALATLLMLAVVVQIFLAGSGAFDTAPNDESFQPHRALGYGILLFAVLLTLIAALARMPGRLIWMTGLVAGLALLQPVIRAIASAFGETGDSTSTVGELIFGLHAINGLIIMAVVGMILRQARELSISHAPGRSGVADAEASGSAAEPAHPAS
jgi:Kef-type K+ transport system membrane component KefB